MLARIKDYFKRNHSDLFIIAVIVFVALIAFGIGRLSAPKSEPVLIRNLEQASVEDLIPGQNEEAIQRGNEGTIQGEYKGQVVGSKNSDKYHLPDCPGAKQISEQNKVWFNSIAEAEKAGYSPAANCPGLK